MGRFAACVVLISSLVVGVTPVMAHHSFAAEFNRDKRITLQGTLTKHIWIYLDVKDRTGNVVAWQ